MWYCRVKVALEERVEKTRKLQQLPDFGFCWPRSTCCWDTVSILKIWLRQGIMSSKVGDPEARRGEPQMGNPTRGSEKYTRLPRHARRISTFTIGGEKYTRLPRQSWMGALTIGLRNFLNGKCWHESRFSFTVLHSLVLDLPTLKQPLNCWQKTWLLSGGLWLRRV